MTARPPVHPKIYHITPVDRLSSIVADGSLFCDATMITKNYAGTTIGMSEVKRRRLGLRLTSRPELHVGDCVPFYFCPRSVMLFLLHRGNHPNLTYSGGQVPIIHLELDLRKVVAWAEQTGLRWAFTTSNAGAYYFEDRCDLDQLEEVNWVAVHATQWSGPEISDSLKEGKQAEFLVEKFVPWALVERVGAISPAIIRGVYDALGATTHRPRIEVCPTWYY